METFSVPVVDDDGNEIGEIISEITGDTYLGITACVGDYRMAVRADEDGIRIDKDLGTRMAIVITACAYLQFGRRN